MHRLLAATLAIVLASPALAATMDDFDCVSDSAGPGTPAGTLRISSDAQFAWLDPDTAEPGPFHPFTLEGERVLFDPAFADHIAPGGSLLHASYFADAFTFEAVVVTAAGQPVLVSCPFIP